MPTSDEWLTAPQAAARLGQTRDQFNHLAKKGRIAPAQLVGGSKRPTRLFTAEAVEALRSELIEEAQAKITALGGSDGEAAA